MSLHDDVMEAFLQDFEGKRNGSMVTGFLVIAEVEHPDQPNRVGYTYFSKGSPALRLGLAEQLSWAIRDDMEENRHEEDE
jgi:hypothetical protein